MRSGRSHRIGVLGLVLASACATTTSKSAVELLQESVEAYNHAFRWKNYERAAQYLPQAQRAGFLAAYEDDESSLQVEDFTVRSVEVLSEKAATVSIKVSYLMLPSTSVQQSTLVQHWAEVNGAWVLEAEDNSIRKIEAGAVPRDPRARQPEPDPEPGVGNGDTTVDVVRPGDPTGDRADDEGDPDEP